LKMPWSVRDGKKVRLVVFDRNMVKQNFEGEATRGNS